MRSLLPQYWYVVAESHELTTQKVLARQILDEHLACYRDQQGRAVVAQDRCIHRCARLSSGTVQDGQLTCRYHGWVYGNAGQVVEIPTEGSQQSDTCRIKAKTYRTAEQDGYVYVCLETGEHTPDTPRLLSQLRAPARGVIRLQNRFGNSLANCVENYIDVPHTAYVHRGIFRKPAGRQLRTTITRQQGEVHIRYQGESFNLGSFSFFLNPQGVEISHTDHFYAPNVTTVHYELPRGYRYFITSQSVPVSAMETIVYTDVSYDFGFWTPFASGIVRSQAQTVIDQDVAILNEQGTNIRKYGERFYPTSADQIHTLISEIIDSLKLGIRPSEIASAKQEITFCV